MTDKACIIYIEMVFPEKMGVSSSKWVVWCEDLSDRFAEPEFPATVVEGAARGAKIFQALVDTQKARGYRVLYDSKEI